MKFRVSVVLPQNGRPSTTHDITLSCDVTATVSDIAHALVRAGLSGDPRLDRIAAERLAPITLRALPGTADHYVMLDPMTSVGASGLQSGWILQPLLEIAGQGESIRLIPLAGSIEVLNGKQRGVQFSLITGSNHIGRDRMSRVHLHDPGVSRRHATITVDEVGNTTIIDTGSANGLLIGGERYSEYLVTRITTVSLGETEIRITPGPATRETSRFAHRILHTRAPRIAPRFRSSERELPAPPKPAQPSRIPMLAMLAPMLLGGVMFAITRSPMSLMMIAFSPMMMIGSWIDGKLNGKRRLKKDTARFAEDLAEEQTELVQLRQREIEVRATETPTVDEVRTAITRRDELLWTRRPEHRAFLEVRFGEGVLPSRTVLKLPTRGESPREHWQMLKSMVESFEQVSPVPVIERFDRCGSIGVAGDRIWAEGLATSLVLQLVGLHSPYELVLACFAGPRHAESWGWLKWLPHVDPVASPIPTWQLADTEQSSLRLLIALEGLLEARSAASHGRGSGTRSHLDVDTRNDDGQGDAVTGLPTIPAVVVLVLEDRFVDQSRLIELGETGPDHGIHLLWVAQDRAATPAACRTFVELGTADGVVNFVRSGSRVPLTRVDHLDSLVANGLARRLAPVEDSAARVLDESDLPKAVNLRELHEVDLLGGAGPILQSWERTGSLISAWQQGQDRPPVSLAAVVGQGPDGPAEIDLRIHGPHALVGGTTGAGKSEFLQTWIMSMASRVSPDRLTFLMVDYKGGAAFAECVDLPHTVGLVTDLSPHLVRRALTSLRAELHYREELLAAHGAKDLISMERRSDPAAPPVLIIVIDEFATLAREVPEFVDGVIDVAQRGRSLGLHLVMATQRPAGVIKDNLRANTNLRVALRMADESDSKDVIGVVDSAFFDAEAPGRGAIKVGPGRISHFQTGYLGGRASQHDRAPEIELRSLGFLEGEPWAIPAEPAVSAKPASTEAQARDIERLRDGIIEANRAAGLRSPRRPWLDELPTALNLEDLRKMRSMGDGRGPVIGLRDDPEAQTQYPVSIDFEEVGSMAIIGAGGTGKTSALLTLAAALSSAAAEDPVRIYGIDAANGALDTVSPLPTVGAVAKLSDTELANRVLQHMTELISERGPRYAAARAGSLAAYRRSPGGAAEPRVFLLLDGFAAFRQSVESISGTEQPLQKLSEIMMNGRAVGVHVVITSDRPSAIPASMAANLQQQFSLRLANPNDYGALGIKSDALEDAPPGRAVAAGDTRELHLALVDGRSELSSQARGIEALAAALHRDGIAQVPEIVKAPAEIPIVDLPVSSAGRPIYGINVRSFDPISMPTRGLGVVAGPSGAGLSQGMLSCVAAQERFAAEQGEPVDTILLSFVDDGLQRSREWGRIAASEEEIERLAEKLVVALGGRPPARRSNGIFGGGLIGDPGPAPSNAKQDDSSDPASGDKLEFPAAGATGVIVVERPAEAEGSAALSHLVALAKAARRSNVLVLFEYEMGAASAIWDLYQALKQPTWGLSLQPDDGESQSPFRESLGRVKRADFPPGRGFAIEGGRTTPVHVARAG
ncbi:FtsK/SpoIIIE domain-containing protein [Leucobacter sp. GX24907]